MINRQKIPSVVDFETANAYWISPGGEIRPVKTTHIRDVIDYPEEFGEFGLNPEHIQDLYELYGEKLGIEGKARKEIMTNLLNKGWIRIRYHSRNDRYSIETGRLTKRTREYIAYWALKKMEMLPERKYTEVTFGALSTGISIQCSLNDLPEKIMNFRVG